MSTSTSSDNQAQLPSASFLDKSLSFDLFLFTSPSNCFLRCENNHNMKQNHLSPSFPNKSLSFDPNAAFTNQKSKSENRQTAFPKKSLAIFCKSQMPLFSYVNIGKVTFFLNFSKFFLPKAAPYSDLTSSDLCEHLYCQPPSPPPTPQQISLFFTFLNWS